MVFDLISERITKKLKFYNLVRFMQTKNILCCSNSLRETTATQQSGVLCVSAAHVGLTHVCV